MTRGTAGQDVSLSDKRYRNGVLINEAIIERYLATCHPLTPTLKAKLLAIFAEGAVTQLGDGPG